MGMGMNMAEPPKSSIFSSFGFWLLIIGIIAAIVGALFYFTDIVSSNLINLGLIGIGVLLLIIGIILLVVRSKKNKKVEEEFMRAQQMRQQQEMYQPGMAYDQGMGQGYGQGYNQEMQMGDQGMGQGMGQGMQMGGQQAPPQNYGMPYPGY